MTIDPQAWLADVLARLPDHPAKRIHELMPWNWRPQKSLKPQWPATKLSSSGSLSLGVSCSETELWTTQN